MQGSKNCTRSGRSSRAAWSNSRAIHREGKSSGQGEEDFRQFARSGAKTPGCLSLLRHRRCKAGRASGQEIPDPLRHLVKRRRAFCRTPLSRKRPHACWRYRARNAVSFSRGKIPTRQPRRYRLHSPPGAPRRCRIPPNTTPILHGCTCIRICLISSLQVV